MPRLGVAASVLVVFAQLAAGGPGVQFTPSSCPSELGSSQLQATVSRSPAPVNAPAPHVEETQDKPPLHNAERVIASPGPRKVVRDLALLVNSYNATIPASVVLIVLIAVVWFMTRKQTSQDDCAEAANDAGEASDIMRTRALVQESRSPNVTDAMTYRADGFMTWEVFFGYSFTVWKSAGVWKMARRLFQMSLFVAVLELLLASDPSALDPLRFAQIGVVLNVFVGLLLGFYLASCTNRWFCCVSGFLTLGNCVRNLQMQLHALGAKKSHCDLAIRYGVSSAWLLNFQMRSLGKPAAEQPEAKQQMWETLQTSTSKFAKLDPEEIEMLKNVSDYPGLIWIWVGSLLGRLANDGEIPGMASPTYGRIVQLAQDAQGAMRKVRSTIVVQMPFAYVHTLATIVHINSILSAVSFGLTLGASFGSVFVHLNPHLHLWNVRPHPAHLLIQDAQFILIQFFKCFLAPVVYQSFFEIGLGIAQPFVRTDGAIPVERLLRKLEADLRDADRLLSEPPHWKKPCYADTEAPKKP